MLGVALLLAVLISIGLINGTVNGGEFIVLIPVLLLIIFIIWVHFNTYYRLSKEEGLFYKSGPLSGTIEINKIVEVVKGKTIRDGLLPPLARKGLIIKSNKCFDIYITPISNDLFIKMLLDINKDIVVI
jgi:hypothetical protein